MKRESMFKGLRSFLLLWGSQSVSELGTAMTDYALIIWIYGQKGTASSITTLTVCAFMPTILFRFAAGALADRWNKKRIMLAADLLAACGTLTVLALYTFSALKIWHLYVVNALLSFMNAFQAPASFVAASLLAPREQYTRVAGLQGFSGSAVSILAPALGSFLLAYGGMTVVLVFDLASFAIAFFTLLFFIRIPETEPEKKEADEPFTRSCLNGIRFLRDHSALLCITLFFTVINFLANMGNDRLTSPYVLARTGNDQRALGLVQSAVAAGILAGSLAVTFLRPAKDKTRLVFVTCALTCLGGVVQSLTGRPWILCAAGFGGYMMAAVMNANLTAVMREHAPLPMQGRVFSAKDTLQNCSIPPALFLGGLLADRVFEPFMAGNSHMQKALSRLFGAGSGSGIAILFFCAGVLGTAISLAQLRKTVYRDLNS